MRVRFTKMQGAGNDFVVIDTRTTAFDADAFDQAGRRALADRHTGIGCDQLLLLCPPQRDEADVRVRIFNTDGSESGQCGNGMRCITRYLHDRQPDQTGWCLESSAGLMAAKIESDGSVSVEQGRPELGSAATGCITSSPVEIDGARIEFAPVSMGNPHAVIFVDNVETAEVATLGVALQQFFRDGVNVGFAQKIGENHLTLRVFERGVGETRACGSGACAAAVAAIHAGMRAGTVTVDLPGGQLMVKYPGAGEKVWLRGPAQQVFEGQAEL